MTSSQPRVPYCPRAAGYERRCVSPSPIAVAMIPAPHSRIRWSMRCPSLDTNHFAVSQIWYIASAMSAPCSTHRRRRPHQQVALRRQRRPSSGSVMHSLAHDPRAPVRRSSSALAAARHEALAAAIAVARGPASARPRRPSRSGMAKNPHPEPTRARTPMPASSSWRDAPRRRRCAPSSTRSDDASRGRRRSGRRRRGRPGRPLGGIELAHVGRRTCAAPLESVSATRWRSSGPPACPSRTPRSRRRSRL